MQEVDKNCRRSGKVDQAAELAKLVGMHASYGKAMDFHGGEYGLAILSPLNLVTTHLDLDAAQRLSQSGALLKALNTAPALPLILCGDFYDVPHSPADKPDSEIDHVFLRGLEAAGPVVVPPQRN